jgi:hypothetical protein
MDAELLQLVQEKKAVSSPQSQDLGLVYRIHASLAFPILVFSMIHEQARGAG